MHIPVYGYVYMCRQIDGQRAKQIDIELNIKQDKEELFDKMAVFKQHKDRWEEQLTIQEKKRKTMIKEVTFDVKDNWNGIS